MKYTFGTSQMTKETPKAIQTLYHVIMFISFMWLMGVEPRFNLSDKTAHLIDVSIGIGNIGIYGFCICFGYPTPEGMKDPTESNPQPLNK